MRLVFLSPSPKGSTMPRHAFIGKVRSDRLAEYRLRHAAVWPDMLAALRAAGFRNYSIFLRPDGLLFAYLESDDYPAALAAMQTTEVNARWQAGMAPFFEVPDGASPDLAFIPLEEVFHLE